MQTRTHNPFTTIHTEGALLPTDLLQRVLAVDPKLEGLTPADYHLTGSEKLNEAINRSWNRLQGSWGTFRMSRARLGDGDAGTTLTRERWLLPLFQELGYGRLQTSKAIELDGKSYPISHKWNDTPIHLVGCGIELDRRTAGAAGASRSSPHSLLQELLNRKPELLWGLVSNGLRLRVLRDNASLTRQAFLEFDLESMFEGEVYSDFAVLWLICHQSRVESREQKVESCWLETWSKAAQEQGTRALESLRQGVEGAISVLGSGFLRHPANQKLRTDLRSGALSTQDYYRQLLRLVYRLIFLFVAEDRDLLFDPASSPQARSRYLRYYSLGRLRRLAERSRGGRHPDLYAVLRLVTDILGGRKDSGVGRTGLGLPVLGGFLFAGEALGDLESAELENESLLSAIRHLTLMDEGRNLRAVDYRNLGSEELGSIYESLLELHPLVNPDAATFELTNVSGSERKTTGSYYTPSSLIQVLLDSALEPVIQQAVANAGSSIEDQQSSILNLKVCDPACGSGHFLVAASHRLARRLATVRTGEGEPAPEALRSALRQVISNCIYGVDINPMSVELCKVSLWMEALEPGKPLSFLDAHIQCGDSLVGVAPGLDVSEIPDEAFNPAFGDDKATSSALKKRNKTERGGQMGLDVFVVRDEEDLQAWMAQKAKSVDALPEETVEQVGQKAQNYHDYLHSSQYQHRKQEYDLWTVAFFWTMEAQLRVAGILAPTQEMLRQHRSSRTLPPDLAHQVEELSERLNLLHWELRFPKVFTGDTPGFDCVLGNPPWEMLQLEEQEFFASKDPGIASLVGDARKKAIAALVKTDTALSREFQIAKHHADAQNKYFRLCGRYPLTSIGKMNTYALFADHFYSILSANGYAGIILPTGIATDDGTKDFFRKLVKNHSIVSLLDFQNREALFPGVHRSYKFCLFTLCKSGVTKSDFVFFAVQVEDLHDEKRRFSLSPEDIVLLNPNTQTMPVFRSRMDSDVTRKIYMQVPVLENENNGCNLWNIQLRQGLFNMTSDSNLFKLESKEGFLPLYEAKFIWHFDHRLSTFDSDVRDVTVTEKSDPRYSIRTRYFVDKSDIDISAKYFIIQRAIADMNNERRVIMSVIPYSGIGNSALIHLIDIDQKDLLCCYLANFNTLIMDYIIRIKAQNPNLNQFIIRQLAVLPPGAYSPSDIDFIASRVLELVYTAYDLRPFAEDMGYHGEPFRWNEVRRAQLRAELDAYYARLYGLTRDELRYILDPKEVYGEDFPGETFRVLKDKEIRQFGEFRTRRLVLDAWDKLEGVEVSAYSVGQSPEASVQPAAYKPVMVEEPVAVPAKPAPKKEPKAVEENPAQPMLSDFGLYKCGTCGKMVMGYEKENHEKDVHKGKGVEWGRVK
jgi:hypothetical protein